MARQTAVEEGGYTSAITMTRPCQESIIASCRDVPSAPTTNDLAAVQVPQPNTHNPLLARTGRSVEARKRGSGAPRGMQLLIMLAAGDLISLISRGGLQSARLLDCCVAASPPDRVRRWRLPSTSHLPLDPRRGQHANAMRPVGPQAHRLPRTLLHCAVVLCAGATCSVTRRMMIDDRHHHYRGRRRDEAKSPNSTSHHTAKPVSKGSTVPASGRRIEAVPRRLLPQRWHGDTVNDMPVLRDPLFTEVLHANGSSRRSTNWPKTRSEQFRCTVTRLDCTKELVSDLSYTLAGPGCGVGCQ